MLLALALDAGVVVEHWAAGDAPSPEDSDVADPEALGRALEMLSGLPPAELSMLEARAVWLARLPPAQQARWLSSRIARARGGEDGGDALGEYIHPSHLAEVLRAETPSIRIQLLRLLPSQLAEQCAGLLGVGWGDGEPAPATLREASAEVLRVIRAKFLSRFVRAGELPTRTETDRLSGAELRRLIKLMGAAEIAYACRHVSREDVAHFLSRFPPEDRHLVISLIEPHARVEPRRAELAESLVTAALAAQTPPESMLNYVGIRLLAIALAEGGEARLRYTAQKIPFAAAGELTELAAAGRGAVAPEIVRAMTEETERLAVGLRQPQTRG